MNKQQRDKLLARSEHLLDLFIALREKYAMLVPLAFDDDLAGRIGRGPQVRGQTLLRNVLLQSCVQDLVKLTLDASERAPNAWNIMQTLGGDGVREALKAEYTVVPPRSSRTTLQTPTSLQTSSPERRSGCRSSSMNIGSGSPTNGPP